MKRTILLFASVVTVVGCGGGPDFGGLPPAQITTANASTWAKASAPNLWAYGIIPLFLGSSIGTTSDPTCPMRTTNGDQTTITGGCTDSHGTMFSGTVTATGLPASGATSGSLPSSITYDNWTVTQMCMGQSAVVVSNGSYTSSVSGGVTNFHVQLTLSGSGANISTMTSMMGSSCMVSSSSMDERVVVDYSGSYTGTTVSFGGSSPPSTWNGSGRYGSTELGVLNTTTHDELLDGMMCQYTPLSGTTTITSGSDTAVITYQGATACDMTASAAWTLNGAPQANLTGIQCSVRGPIGARGGAGGGLAALGAAAAVAFGARSRRRRRGAPSRVTR